MQLDNLLSLYQRGLISRGELVFALGERITPENVDTVMSRVPREFLADMREWAFTTPSTGGVLIWSNFSQSEEHEVSERVRQAVPALREWFRRADADEALKQVVVSPDGENSAAALN